MSETATTTDGDYIAAFAEKHKISETELRAYVAEGPKVTRWFLAQVEVVDDFPRKPRARSAARGENTEVKK